MSRLVRILSWACLAAGGAAGQGETAAFGAEVAALLRAQASQTEDAAARLAGLGPLAAPDLFAILAAGRVPAADGAAGGDGGPALDARQRAALLAALVALDGAGLQAARAAVAAAPAAGAREAALAVAAGLPARADVALLIELADGGADELPGPVEDRLIDALAALLAFAPDAHRDLARALDRPACRGAALRAVGRVADPRGIDVLVAAVQTGDAWSLGALSQLVLVAPFVRETDPWLVRTLIGCLVPADRARCELAAQALAELAADDAVPYLIELLADGDPGVRASACRALQRMSGLPLGPDAAGWELWHRAEERWAEETLPALLAALDGDATARRRALAELACHPLQRRAVEEALLARLDDPDAELRVQVAGALARLGPRASVPRLLELREDVDAALAEAARTALARAARGDRGPAELAATHARWDRP